MPDDQLLARLQPLIHVGRPGAARHRSVWGCDLRIPARPEALGCTVMLSSGRARAPRRWCLSSSITVVARSAASGSAAFLPCAPRSRSGCEGRRPQGGAAGTSVDASPDCTARAAARADAQCPAWPNNTPAAGRRFELPLPRLPRDARPARPGRHARPAPSTAWWQHDEEAARAVPGRATRPASSTPRARPSATTGTPSTRPTARRCPTTWRARSSRSTRWCGCSAGRC